MTVPASGSLLLVTHVPIRALDEGHFIDDQTARGIAQWCRHFEFVTYVGIADTDHQSSSSSNWVNLDLCESTRNCRVVALPNAYKAVKMARHYRRACAELDDAIEAHEHLCFTIGGLVGDWPAIAAIRSIKKKRDFTAWLDRVEPEVIKSTLDGASLMRRLKHALMIPVMERFQRFILSRSSTALLQGMDTFNYFANSAGNPQCIYDTHTTELDRISDEARNSKKSRIIAGGPLEIVYAGRAVAMKGTSDWLSVLEELDRRNVPFRARWIGDGPDVAQMMARIEASGPSKKVEMLGFEGDREVLLEHLRRSDFLLFCHKSMESPRCLIEALVCGCPIVGYHSHYATGLTEQFGGALLGPKNDIRALVEIVEGINNDRDKLVHQVDDAANSGKLYSENIVYSHRAHLMRNSKN